jgi:Flp pilus assembly protein TadG
VARLPSLVRIREGESGVAAIEFAIIAPLMAIILVGVTELSFAVRQRMQVQEAAAAGAQYAALKGWDPANIALAVTSAANGSGISATPTATSYCGCPSASGIAVLACGQPCPDRLTARAYVQVNASMTRTTLLASSLGLPTVLTASVTTRTP